MLGALELLSRSLNADTCVSNSGLKSFIATVTLGFLLANWDCSEGGVMGKKVENGFIVAKDMVMLTRVQTKLCALSRVLFVSFAFVLTVVFSSVGLQILCGPKPGNENGSITELLQPTQKIPITTRPQENQNFAQCQKTYE